MCACFLHAVYVRMCVHVCVYVYVCCSRAAPGFMLAAWVGLVAGGELSFVSKSFLIFPLLLLLGFILQARACGILEMSLFMVFFKSHGFVIFHYFGDMAIDRRTFL